MKPSHWATCSCRVGGRCSWCGTMLGDSEFSAPAFGLMNRGTVLWQLCKHPKIASRRPFAITPLLS